MCNRSDSNHDAVTAFVSALVIFDGQGSRFPAGNAAINAFLIVCVPEPFGAIAPAGKHPLRLGQIVEQGCRAGIIADLSSGDEEAQGAAMGIGDGVKLGIHAALRASDQAAAIPFFTRRLEAVRCAFR